MDLIKARAVLFVGGIDEIDIANLYSGRITRNVMHVAAQRAFNLRMCCKEDIGRSGSFSTYTENVSSRRVKRFT